MINTNYLIARSSELLDTSEDIELKQRLGLYQVFLRLYEHNRGLLDEILELENSGSKALSGMMLPFMQGIVQNQKVQLATNLITGKSQVLTQPQQVWTVGRDSRQVSLPIQDKRLSRCHAAIRYVDRQGFYLIDLDSSNGSFVNGERIRNPYLLKDGDRIRLGSLTISFFLCEGAQVLKPLPAELMARLDRANTDAMLSDRTEFDLPRTAIDPSPPAPVLEETILFLQSKLWQDKPSAHPPED